MQSSLECDFFKHVWSFQVPQIPIIQWKNTGRIHAQHGVHHFLNTRPFLSDSSSVIRNGATQSYTQALVPTLDSAFKRSRRRASLCMAGRNSCKHWKLQNRRTFGRGLQRPCFDPLLWGKAALQPATSRHPRAGREMQHCDQGILEKDLTVNIHNRFLAFKSGRGY